MSTKDRVTPGEKYDFAKGDVSAFGGRSTTATTQLAMIRDHEVR
jgi:hypothetical protein